MKFAYQFRSFTVFYATFRYKRPQHPSLNLDDHLPRKQPNSTNVIREPMCSPDQINDESQTAGCSCRQVMETSFNNNFQHQNNDLYKPAPFHRSADQFQHFPVGCRSLDVTVPNRPFSCHLDHHDEELYIDGMSLCSSPSVKMVKDMSFKGYPLPGLTNITKMPHDNIVMYKESSLGNVHDRLDMRFVASPHEVLCQKCSESLESLYHDGYSE